MCIFKHFECHGINENEYGAGTTRSSTRMIRHWQNESCLASLWLQRPLQHQRKESHSNNYLHIKQFNMAAAAINNVNMMEDIQSFGTILINFRLTQRVKNRPTEDFPTANDLMASNVEQIKSVVTNQNKMYRSHVTAGQRCYINTARLNRILAFFR